MTPFHNIIELDIRPEKPVVYIENRIENKEHKEN